MKKYNPVYYLLFILLVMGAFASMAQNSYGLTIMGGVAFAFGIVFFLQFIYLIRKQESGDVFSLLEPVCLSLLSIIFGMRVLYIRFPYVEWIFVTVALLLMFIYLRKMIFRYLDFRSANRSLAILVLVFHLSIILFLISLAMVPFAPGPAEITGIAAFILMLGFIVAGFFKKEFLIKGEVVTPYSMVLQLKDYSIIIVTLFLLFSFYTGFNRIGALPAIYSDEFPRAYFELVNNAESKKEKPVDGRYKHQLFMEKYEEFLEHNRQRDQ